MPYVVTYRAESDPSEHSSKAVFYLWRDVVNNLLDYALKYAGLGWSIFPIEPGGKKPLIKWEKFQKEQATSEQIGRWWKKYPNANIGLVTGMISNLVVMDIDSMAGIERYIAHFTEIHNTITQKTGKPDAKHLLFIHPQDKKYPNKAPLIEDIDVRGDGGYILVAPSVHPNGTVYEWIIDPTEMGLDDLLELPDEIKSKFTEISQTESTKTKGIPAWVREILGGVEDGKRHDVCAKLTGYYLRIFGGDVEQTQLMLQIWNENNEPPLDWKDLRTVIKSIVDREGRDALGESVGETIEKIQILKYVDGDRKYRVYLKDHPGHVEMSTANLVIFSQFKIKFTELADKIPKQMTQVTWERRVNKALDEAETVMISEEETKIGAVTQVINQAIFSDGCETSLDYISNHIVLNKDIIYLTQEVILHEFALSPEKFTRKELGKILRDLGFVHERIGSRTKRFRCWQRAFNDIWKKRYN